MPRVALRIPADHPAFDGHFPGRPIVPGVLLLELALQAIEAGTGLAPEALPTVKFLSPALPGDALVLDYEADGAQLRFTVLCGERTIASGRFSAPAASAA